MSIKSDKLFPFRPTVGFQYGLIVMYQSDIVLIISCALVFQTNQDNKSLSFSF